MMSRPFPFKYASAALRTIDSPRWVVWCARLFGKRIVCIDGDTTVVLREWRGKTYLIDYFRSLV